MGEVSVNYLTFSLVYTSTTNSIFNIPRIFSFCVVLVVFSNVFSFMTQQQKIETEKKADEGAKKEDSPPVPAPVVYKLDLHCEGCIKKIKRSARHFAGNLIYLFLDLKL